MFVKKAKSEGELTYALIDVIRRTGPCKCPESRGRDLRDCRNNLMCTPPRICAHCDGHPDEPCDCGWKTPILNLLEDGADINATSKGGYSPLLVACSLGSHRIVQLLLREKADPLESDSHDWSPLHEAAKGNRQDICQLLLNATPLPDTAEEMAAEAAKGLKENEWYLRRAAAEALGKFGSAADSQVLALKPLLAKAQNPQVRAATALALSKLSAEAIVPCEGDLQDCCGEKDYKIREPAERAVKKIETWEKKEKGQSGPEDEAHENTTDEAKDEPNIFEIGEELRAIRRISLINSQNKWGSTPFHEAAEGGFEDLIGMFISMKAELNNELRDGTTALMMSAKAGDYETCKVLLQHQCMVCAKGCKGKCRCGNQMHTPIFNGEKKSAMTLASERTRTDPKYIDVVRLLRQHGLK